MLNQLQSQDVSGAIPSAPDLSKLYPSLSVERENSQVQKIKSKPIRVDMSRFVGLSEQELEEFTCGICCEIFVNPFVTQCCRQTYCEDCINEWLTHDNTCPNDRKSLSYDKLSPAPRVVYNLLNNLKIKCDFQSNGCKSIIPLNELSKHIKDCEFNPHTICAKCGHEGQGHNCIENLLDQVAILKTENESFSEEFERMRKENSELKKFIEEQLSEDMVGLGKNSLEQNSHSVLESARNYINSSNQLDISTKCVIIGREIPKQLCIEQSVYAILNNNSYKSIASHIHQSLITFNENKRWNIIVFERTGAESIIFGEDYLRMSFADLVIDIICSGNI